MNNGFSVNHARAGKKCMGTTRPGNSSGSSMVNGSLAAKGPNMLANAMITNTKLKIISPLLPSHLFNAQYPTAASKQANVLTIIMFTGLATDEKSPQVDEVYTR